MNGEEKEECHDRTACDRSNGHALQSIKITHSSVCFFFFFRLITRVSNLFINMKLKIMFCEWDGSVDHGRRWHVTIYYLYTDINLSGNVSLKMMWIGSVNSFMCCFFFQSSIMIIMSLFLDRIKTKKEQWLISGRDNHVKHLMAIARNGNRILNPDLFG